MIDTNCFSGFGNFAWKCIKWHILSFPYWYIALANKRYLIGKQISLLLKWFARLFVKAQGRSYMFLELCTSGSKVKVYPFCWFKDSNLSGIWTVWQERDSNRDHWISWILAKGNQWQERGRKGRFRDMSCLVQWHLCIQSFFAVPLHFTLRQLLNGDQTKDWLPRKQAGFHFTESQRKVPGRLGERR